jgi:hypothetical protein
MFLSIKNVLICNKQIFIQQGQGFAETLVGPENYWPNENGTIFGGFLRNRRNNAVDLEGRVL